MKAGTRDTLPLAADPCWGLCSGVWAFPPGFLQPAPDNPRDFAHEHELGEVARHSIEAAWLRSRMRLRFRTSAVFGVQYVECTDFAGAEAYPPDG